MMFSFIRVAALLFAAGAPRQGAAHRQDMRDSVLDEDAVVEVTPVTGTGKMRPLARPPRASFATQATHSNLSCEGKLTPDSLTQLAWLCLQVSLNFFNFEVQMAIKGTTVWSGDITSEGYKAASLSIHGAIMAYWYPGISLHLVAKGELSISSAKATDHLQMVKLAVKSMVQQQARLALCSSQFAWVCDPKQRLENICTKLSIADLGFNKNKIETGQTLHKFQTSMETRIQVLRHSLAHKVIVTWQSKRHTYLESSKQDVDNLRKILAKTGKESHAELKKWWMDHHGDQLTYLHVDSPMGPIAEMTPEAPDVRVQNRQIGDSLIRNHQHRIAMIGRMLAEHIQYHFFAPAAAEDTWLDRVNSIFTSAQVEPFACDSELLHATQNVPLSVCSGGDTDCYKTLLDGFELEDDIEQIYKVMNSDTEAIAHPRLICWLTQLPQARETFTFGIDQLQMDWKKMQNPMSTAVLVVLGEIFAGLRDHWLKADKMRSRFNPTFSDSGNFVDILSFLETDLMELGSFLDAEFTLSSILTKTEKLVDSVGDISSKERLQSAINPFAESSSPTRTKSFGFDWTLTGTVSIQANVGSNNIMSTSVCTSSEVGFDGSRAQAGAMTTTKESMAVWCGLLGKCDIFRTEKCEKSSTYYVLSSLSPWQGKMTLAPTINLKFEYTTTSAACDASGAPDASSSTTKDRIFTIQFVLGGYSGTGLTATALAEGLALPALAIIKDLKRVQAVFMNADNDGKRAAAAIETSFANSLAIFSVNPVVAALAASTTIADLAGATSLLGGAVGIEILISVPVGSTSPQFAAKVFLVSSLTAGSSQIGQLTSLASGMGWGALLNIAKIEAVDLFGCGLLLNANASDSIAQ